VTIGGFNGADPPTVAQLQAMVAGGELRYALLSSDGRSGGPGGPRGDTSQALAAWVQQHGTVVSGVDTGGMTLYRLSS
jgi:hypothetical protein